MRAKFNFQNALLYVSLMAVAVLVFAEIFNSAAPFSSTVSFQAAHFGGLKLFQDELLRNISNPVTSLIIQILAIIAFSRACSFVLGKLGQPKVVAEMIAGILLGKSVFGIIWPEGFAQLFPESSMPRLFFLSQIGLIFFMFTVGLNLKISELKNRSSAAVLISHVSIVFPFLLGTAIALLIYKNYGPKDFSFHSFALFMGIAMSITAFPVLARIIQEKGMTDTPIGAMALTCAAIDDVTAWCILASVIGIVRAGTAATAVFILGGAIVYVFSMLRIVKPIIEKILRPATLSGELTQGQLAFLFCVLLGSAITSEVIGIHSVFGAFLAGTIMPRSFSFRKGLIEKVEDLTVVIFLPLFFVYTGLRMQIGLLSNWDSWMVCTIITAAAIVGKLFGSAVAARWTGMNWREAWTIGALMNTRGLMELVVLNIGYDLGIISPVLFTILVLMAILTTMMTTPLLTFLLPELNAQREPAEIVDGSLAEAKI